MLINPKLTLAQLKPSLEKVNALAAKKVRLLEKNWNPKNLSDKGTPVFTVNGQYTARGWTEWTQGFQYGLAILSFDATGEKDLLQIGRKNTVEKMLPHVTHIGVHDHGFNNLSTYGNLRRLMLEGRIPQNEWELRFYETAIKASGAVQASRWSGIPGQPNSKHAAFSNSLGYVYSFNGPHSLFVDTMRTIRIMGAAWKLGHVLMHENDRAANLLKRSVLHALATSQYIVFHGDSTHTYDIAGRTAHEAVFNRNDGNFRCRSSQQGYSPFSTWTRGLAWAMLGYAEELEFIDTIDATVFKNAVGLAKKDVVAVFERCAIQTCDHYINDVTASDGIPYWDDGAPGLSQLNEKIGNWKTQPAQPRNDFEPVDSSAAAIAAQGLIRLGNYLGSASGGKGKKYSQAGLNVAQTLMTDEYLALENKHQGLLLHSIYHRPNNWDHIPNGSKIPHGESSMWGDYHLLELVNLLGRMAAGKSAKYPTFF